MPDPIAPIAMSDLADIIGTTIDGAAPAGDDHGGSDDGGASDELEATDALDADDDLDDAAGEAGAADEDDGDLEAADEDATPLTGATLLNTLADAINDPRSIAQAPEEWREPLRLVQERFAQVNGQSYTDGLSAGMEMAELIDLYENDREVWQERVDATANLEQSFHRLYADIKSRKAADRQRAEGGAEGGDKDTYRAMAREALSMLDEYPEARERVVAKIQAEGIDATAEGARKVSEYTRQEYARAVREEAERDSAPKKRAANAKRLRNLPKPDVGGSAAAAPADRVAKMRNTDLTKPGAGRAMLTDALAEIL